MAPASLFTPAGNLSASPSANSHAPLCVPTEPQPQTSPQAVTSLHSPVVGTEHVVPEVPATTTTMATSAVVLLSRTLSPSSIGVQSIPAAPPLPARPASPALTSTTAVMAAPNTVTAVAPTTTTAVAVLEPDPLIDQVQDGALPPPATARCCVLQ